MNAHFAPFRTACALAPALFFLSGCVVVSDQSGYPRREVVVSQPPPPPTVVETAPPPVVFDEPPPAFETVVVDNSQPPPYTEIIVREPPPPPRQEIIIARPSPHHVWVGGYWHWEGHRYGWVHGHWMLPPRERAEWIAPHYERRASGTVYIGGFWRGGSATVAVQSRTPMGPGPGPITGGTLIIRETPPPPRHETMPHRPSPRHLWVGGYWRHDGHVYVWVPGHWAEPPHHDAIWIAPRWEQRGGTWFFIEGRWDHH